MSAHSVMPPSNPITSIVWWLRPQAAFLLSGLYGLWAWALLTNFDLRAVAPEKLGLVFPDMARRMLSWDFSISPNAISFEAFIRESVTYTYYGIFPALLRMPLIPFQLDDLELARVSCIAALVLTVFAYLRLSQIVLVGTNANLLTAAALLSMVLSGPQIFTLASAALYHELIFWSAALTAIFQLIVMASWVRGEPISGGAFYALALLAGLCLLCRVTDGAGLYAALLLLLIYVLVQRWRTLPVGCQLRVTMARPGWVMTLFGAGSVALIFVGVQGYLNFQRWGDPLAASPYQYQTMFLNDPAAVERFNRLGLFSWVRVAMSTAYYATGVKLEQVAPTLLVDYYGGIEGPRAIVPLTAPLLFVMATVGLWHMVRHPLVTFVPGLTAAGSLVGVLLMLGFHAICLRYAFDGWGLLVLIATLGLRPLAMMGRPRLIGLSAIALLGLGIAGSHLTLLRYKIVYSGTDAAVRYGLSRILQPLLCPRAPLDPSIKLTDFNPLVTPNCPPIW